MSVVPPVLDAVIVPQGATVFRQGDPGACAYLIERGAVEITIEKDGDPLRLAERRKGEIFGEMAIIDNKPRTATATALEDTELFLITPEQLSRRIELSDPILRLCLSVVMDRFRETMAKLHGEQAATAPEAVAPNVNVHAGAAKAIEEIKLERELRHAIDRKDFEMYYQPIVDLASGKLAGFEALVRWRHENRGLVSPYVFIPTAETTGLIIPLGRICMEQACVAQTRFGVTAGLGRPVRQDMFVSVNVSGRDFDDTDFVANMVSTLRRTGADPHKLKLEITETMVMQSPERAVEALEQCKLQGLSIAIDDFGAGYSSLGYLHRLPIDTLKIDRSFVLAMHDDHRSMKIIRSILSMARELDIPVVAEGIETAKDATFLRNMGCAFGQGYHFARPMARDKAERFIDGWNPASFDFLPMSLAAAVGEVDR